MLPDGDFKNTLIPIINSYMRKSMAITTNPIHNPPKEVVAEAIQAMLKIINKDRGMRDEAILLLKLKEYQINKLLIYLLKLMLET